MAAPSITPLPPTLEAALAREMSSGQWTQATRQFFIEILKKLIELEQRIAALEP